MDLADDLHGARWCATASTCARARVKPWGIRALAVDKDQSPRWNPARIEDVAPELVQQFFKWPLAYCTRIRWRALR